MKNFILLAILLLPVYLFGAGLTMSTTNPVSWGTYTNNGGMRLGDVTRTTWPADIDTNGFARLPDDQTFTSANRFNPNGVNGLTISTNSNGQPIIAEHGSTASGDKSHAEGNQTTASGDKSHSEGDQTLSSGSNSHTEGQQTIASANNAHAEGQQGSTASGQASHAEGGGTLASSDRAHAEGDSTTASGNQGSHAEGSQTVASGPSCHAEGLQTTASGDRAHTEGYHTQATGQRTHAEGDYTVAEGNYSHSEGQQTYADGESSHSEGYQTYADGRYSHSEGTLTYAQGESSHAAGTRAWASTNNTWIWSGDTSQDYTNDTPGSFQVVSPTSILLRSHVIADSLSVTGAVSAATLSGDGSGVTGVTDANAVHNSDIGTTVLAPNGNGSALTGVIATAPTIVQTNFLTGTTYSNGTGRPIQVSANAALTTALIAGMAQLSLEVPGQVTNRATVLTVNLLGAATGAYTNAVTPAIIPVAGTYIFRNTSTGAGDSAVATGGQILIY